MAGQTIINLGTGGSVLNGQSGSTTGSDSNDPTWLAWPGDNAGNYVYLPGAASNMLTVPHSASLNGTDFEVIAHLAPDSWTSYGTIASRWEGASNAFFFQTTPTGALRLYSYVGATAFDKVSTASVAFAAGSAGWVRATRTAATGTVTFFTSTDGITWTQLGLTSSTTVGSLSAPTLAFKIGEYGFGGDPIAAKIYRVIYRTEVGGANVVDINTAAATGGSVTTFVAGTGQTVTISRAATGRKTATVVSSVWLFGTDDRIQVENNDLLNMGAGVGFTLLTVVREWGTPTAFTGQMSKFAGSGSGYLMGTPSATSDFYGWATDTLGTNSSISGTRQTSGALAVYATVRDASTSRLTVYRNGAQVGQLTSATVNSLTNTARLIFGALSSSPSGYKDMEFVAGAVFRRSLNASEIAQVTTFYTSRLS